MSLQSLQMAQSFFDTYLHSTTQLHSPYSIILVLSNYRKKFQIQDKLLEQLYEHPDMPLFQLIYKMEYGNTDEKIQLPECKIDVSLELTRAYGNNPRTLKTEGNFKFKTDYIPSEPMVYNHSFDSYRGVDGLYSKFKYTQQMFVGVFRNRLMLAMPKFL